MRILFALPGLHRVDRGAEVAFLAVASELSKAGESVTVIGSGSDRAGAPYRYIRAPSVRREQFESFPTMPGFRDECAYEDLTFAPSLLRAYRPADYDVTLTCSYPYTNWALRRPVLRGRRPAHVFVTQNGDWPAQSMSSEFRYFGCEGLVCINPDYQQRNAARWRCRMIPNGVDLSRFQPGDAQRSKFGIPENRLVVLMVSALIPSKRVDVGVETVSRIANAHLVVAGAGPERDAIRSLAERLLPGRHTLLTLSPEQMPNLYRSANVFMHLSKEEAFGNVFVEAMACGLPVVAHDTARTRWIVGDDQFLADTADIAATSSSVIAAGQAGTTAKAARVARAEGFSWPRIASLYREFLAEIVAGRG